MNVRGNQFPLAPALFLPWQLRAGTLGDLLQSVLGNRFTVPRTGDPPHWARTGVPIRGT
jgi:hypothetical protein